MSLEYQYHILKNLVCTTSATRLALAPGAQGVEQMVGGLGQGYY